MAILNEELALDAVKRADAKGFHIGSAVRTKKGAKFWGMIVAIDVDEMNPGVTVMATHPNFRGTKHVYPLAQLELVPLGGIGSWTGAVIELLPRIQDHLMREAEEYATGSDAPMLKEIDHLVMEIEEVLK
jgi:hypothetical protein